jgi:hypothetical protein
MICIAEVGVMKIDRSGEWSRWGAVPVDVVN